MTKKGFDENSLGSDSSAASKRKLLKSLAAGGTVAATLPAKWTTPLVDSVLAPAHAGTSTAPCGDPSCSDGSANITAAVIDGGGDLQVVGEYNVPGSCVDGGAASVLCQVIDEGSVIGTDNRTSSGQGCSLSGQGCIVSCSVEVDTGDHSLNPGDCVTMRFTFDGN